MDRHDPPAFIISLTARSASSWSAPDRWFTPTAAPYCPRRTAIAHPIPLDASRNERHLALRPPLRSQASPLQSSISPPYSEPGKIRLPEARASLFNSAPCVTSPCYCVA